jgi:hypothetical protein
VQEHGDKFLTTAVKDVSNESKKAIVVTATLPEVSAPVTSKRRDENPS